MATTQNTVALVRAQDLQVAKYSSGFAMAHRMALVKMTMGTADASTIPETITYDGNTASEKYRSSKYSSALTSQASFDGFTPYTLSSTYYLIIKSSVETTLGSKCKVTTTTANQAPVYQWSLTTTPSRGQLVTSSPKPVFKNFARLYSYTGSRQIFTPALASVKYKMECWGAAGGYGTGDAVHNDPEGERGDAIECTDGNGTQRTIYPFIENPGKGGYVVGIITLSNTTSLYVYIGQEGYGGDYLIDNSVHTSWNGGGSGSWDHSDEECCGGGGGATDIRTVQCSSTSAWSDVNSLCSRIMVAGGGGGGGPWNSCGGCGGNTTGGTESYMGKTFTVTSEAGSQTSGYRFGTGESGTSPGSNWCKAGGGGGYWGGKVPTASSSARVEQSAPGGSSFISGYSGCKAIKSSAASLSSVASITASYFESHANHYSGMKFTSGMNMISGATSGMPKPTAASGTMTGNRGNGYARITCMPYD